MMERFPKGVRELTNRVIYRITAASPRAERLRLHFVDIVARVLDGRTKAPRLAAQLLVDTTDAAVHRWWVDDDGGIAEPQQLAAELERMVSAYLRETRPIGRAG